MAGQSLNRVVLVTRDQVTTQSVHFEENCQMRGAELLSVPGLKVFYTILLYLMLRYVFRNICNEILDESHRTLVSLIAQSHSNLLRLCDQFTFEVRGWSVIKPGFTC